MTPISTKPYMLRAIYEWCVDNCYTPYIAVFVDNKVQIPSGLANGDEIVLNISSQATNALELGNEWLVFSARFSGVARKLEIPIENILAIYAQENGQGMAFPVEKSEKSGTADKTVAKRVPAAPLSLVSAAEQHDAAKLSDNPLPPTPPAGPRPTLKLIK
jgi:stringent starvation protein B